MHHESTMHLTCKKASLPCQLELTCCSCRKDTPFAPYGAGGFCMSVCLFVYLFIYLSTDLPVYLSIYLSIYLCLSVCLSVYLSIFCRCIDLSIHLSIVFFLCSYQLNYLSIYLSFFLSFFLSIYLSIYLSEISFLLLKMNGPFRMSLVSLVKDVHSSRPTTSPTVIERIEGSFLTNQRKWLYLS